MGCKPGERIYPLGIRQFALHTGDELFLLRRLDPHGRAKALTATFIAFFSNRFCLATFILHMAHESIPAMLTLIEEQYIARGRDYFLNGYGKS